MHLLEKHHIEISSSNMDSARHIQNEIGDVFQQKLYPQLDKLLDQYSVSEKVWEIDKIKITIPGLVLSNWKNDLVNSILKQTEIYLKEHQPHIKPKSLKAEQVQLVSLKRKYHELLITFLIEGNLPPNAISGDFNQVFKNFSIDKSFTGLFLERLGKSNQLNHIVVRMVFNLPETIIKDLIKLFGIESDLSTMDSVLKNHSRTSGEFLKFLYLRSHLINVTQRSYSSENPMEFYQTYFNLSKKELLKETRKWKFELQGLDIKNKKVMLDDIRKLIHDISKSDNELKAKDNPVKNEIEAILEALQDDKNTNSVKEQKYNYIGNAGLVILHPFLVSFFSQLEYLIEHKWKTERHRHRAALLLHYLVYGKSKVFENELILNKILCGVGIADTVNTTWRITKAEKAKCRELLTSVIEHWSVLKDTSVTTLRDTFLKREAKLTEYKKDKHELIIEQKSVDVLLDHLPWGIGTIKTPWMDNYLTCQWT